MEEDDTGEISEPENELMLSRDAKDWKVYARFLQSSLAKLLLLCATLYRLLSFTLLFFSSIAIMIH